MLLLQILEIEPAGVIDCDIANHGTAPRREQSPWKEIRGVLRKRQQNLITLTEFLFAPGSRDKIDALGRAPNPHDLIRTLRMNKLGDNAASVLISLVSPPGQCVKCTSRIRIVM